MPKGDGAGLVMGMGPITGRSAGRCAGCVSPGYGYSSVTRRMRYFGKRCMKRIRAANAAQESIFIGVSREKSADEFIDTDKEKKGVWEKVYLPEMKQVR